VDHLLFVSRSPLVSSILVNLGRVNPNGQHQTCSSWWGLGWHGKSWSKLV
jgi:hypothetical protein